MTKRMVKYSAVLIAFATLFAGCSGSDESGSDALIGRWVWSRLVVKGVTLNPTTQDLTPGGTTIITPAVLAQMGANVSVTATFKQDETLTGTVNATIPGQAPVNQTGSGTWSVSGDELTVRFTQQGRNFVLKGTFDVSGNLLTVSLSNAQLLELLDVNDADLSKLTPDQQALLNGLSGSIEFTR